MKVKDIYNKFGIPPNLQEHMLRVYGVVDFLQKHWNGKENINWELAKKIALLHDMGNVVKFNLDKNPEFLGEEKKNINYWKDIQKKAIEKYGTDDHEATEKMLTEIGTSEKITDTILNKSFLNTIKIQNSHNWQLKILYYSDLRTLPFSIGSVDERLKEAKKRKNIPDFELLYNACKEIEKQIQNNLNVSIDEINNRTVKIDSEVLETEI